MDALLRYLLSKIAFSLLSFEIVLMIVCSLLIVCIKLITTIVTKRREDIQLRITQYLEEFLFKDEPIENLLLQKNLRYFRDLVEVMEKFDLRFNDDRWIEIKNKVVEDCLLPQTKQFAASFSWFKRQLAARAFLLAPQKANKEILEKLLEDRRYLVRVAAAVCITKRSDFDLFKKVIEVMSKENPLSQFPYRDALLNADQEKFKWIADLLSKETNPEIAAIYLDILSKRYSNNLFPLIRPFVNSTNRECRALAIKALGGIPSLESIDLLMAHLYDSDWEIRAESIMSIQKLYVLKAIPKLELLLTDPVWWVRLQAALTLKEFGREGLNVLISQDKEKSPKAYEIAQYAMALPAANY